MVVAKKSSAQTVQRTWEVAGACPGADGMKQQLCYAREPRSKPWRLWQYGNSGDAKEQPNVTIDERLERLTERHEALTQTVERMAAMQKEREKENQDLKKEMTRRFAETLGFINQLAHIAQAHESRIDKLENPE